MPPQSLFALAAQSRPKAAASGTRKLYSDPEKGTNFRPITRATPPGQLDPQSLAVLSFPVAPGEEARVEGTCVIREMRLLNFTAEYRRVTEILVKVGDEVRLGTGLLELETERASVIIPSLWKGVISRIEIQRDQLIEIGDLLFAIDEIDRSPDLADVSLCPLCRSIPQQRGLLHGHGIHPEPDVSTFLAFCQTCDVGLRRSSTLDAYEIVGRIPEARDVRTASDD